MCFAGAAHHGTLGHAQSLSSDLLHEAAEQTPPKGFPDLSDLEFTLGDRQVEA
jgi:hypothetical protein